MFRLDRKLIQEIRVFRVPEGNLRVQIKNAKSVPSSTAKQAASPKRKKKLNEYLTTAKLAIYAPTILDSHESHHQKTNWVKAQ